MMSRIPVINFGNRGGGQPSDDERMRRALRALVQQQEQPAPQASPLRQRADMREAMRMSALAGMAEQTAMRREANAADIGRRIGASPDQIRARTPRLTALNQGLLNEASARQVAQTAAEGERLKGVGAARAGLGAILGGVGQIGEAAVGGIRALYTDPLVNQAGLDAGSLAAADQRRFAEQQAALDRASAERIAGVENPPVPPDPKQEFIDIEQPVEGGIPGQVIKQKLRIVRDKDGNILRYEPAVAGQEAGQQVGQGQQQMTPAQLLQMLQGL